MNDDEARNWLTDHLGVSRETIDRLQQYLGLVSEAQADQNLVGAATLTNFWFRHIVDSAQLILHGQAGSWLDIGSGAGLPGIVIGVVTGSPVTLVEPRSRRAAFLTSVVEKLKLHNVVVISSTIQKMVGAAFDNITARALAPFPAIIEMAMPVAHKTTVWVLPKGKTAQSELASLPRTWQGDWQAVASVTDPASKILVGRHIRVSGKR